MKKQKYFVTKEKYKGNIVSLNIEKKGFKINPKKDLNYDGIRINEMIIIKPSLIEKIIKRKIKNRLCFYLKFLLEEDDADSRVALDDISRYRLIIENKYALHLDNKYLELLNKKFALIENHLQNKICEKVNKRSR